MDNQRRNRTKRRRTDSANISKPGEQETAVSDQNGQMEEGACLELRREEGGSPCTRLVGHIKKKTK